MEIIFLFRYFIYICSNKNIKIMKRIEVIITLVSGIIDEIIPCLTSEMALKEYIKKAKEFGFKYDYDSVKTEEEIQRMLSDIENAHSMRKEEVKWYSDINFIEE